MTGDLRALSEAEREAFPLYARDLLVWNAAERIAADRVAELERRIGELADEWQTNASVLLEQGVIDRAVPTMVGCAAALRAVVRGEEVDRG